MELIPEVLNHIRDKAKNIRFGQITVVMNETSDRVDVVSEERVRFSPKGNDRTSKKTFSGGAPVSAQSQPRTG